MSLGAVAVRSVVSSFTLQDGVEKRSNAPSTFVLDERARGAPGGLAECIQRRGDRREAAQAGDGPRAGAGGPRSCPKLVYRFRTAFTTDRRSGSEMADCEWVREGGSGGRAQVVANSVPTTQPPLFESVGTSQRRWPQSVNGIPFSSNPRECVPGHNIRIGEPQPHFHGSVKRERAR